MDWKFIYNQLTKNSLLINIRIVIFFSQSFMNKRKGADLGIIALPFLIPLFLIFKRTLHNETEIGISIIITISLLFLLAYHVIKRNKNIVLALRPDIHILLKKNLKEFYIIWGLFMLISSLFNVAWYLFLVFFIF